VNPFRFRFNLVRTIILAVFAVNYILRKYLCKIVDACGKNAGCRVPDIRNTAIKIL